MIASIKSEFRKLLSVRSTYIITLLGFVFFGGLLSFYAQGYRASAEMVNSPDFVENIALLGVMFISILTGIVAVLMVTHEYRHNTIAYTLTNSNSRTKSLLAKAIVIAIYAVVVGVVAMVIGPLLARLGVSLQGASLAPQAIGYWDIAWRGIFYSFGNAMAAIVIAVIIRNQIGAIATYFVGAGMVEELLTLVLKENAKFLPFRALNQVINSGAASAEMVRETAALTIGQNAMVFTAYLVVGSLVAWILFLRRDAN